MPVTGIGGGPTRLAGPANVPTADTVIFAAAVPTILRDFKLSTSTSGTVALGINGSAVPNQVLPTVSGAASSLTTFALDIPLVAGDMVHLLGSVTTQNYTLTGEIAGQGAA
ncbi:MAG: hypothetical protein ABSD62_12055 [Candidatus Limnocylindrales bacterium]|jgi:hypothetical protein